MTARRRLDAELVRRGLVASREKAVEAVLAGRVLVGGAPAAKPSRLVSPAEPVLIEGPGPRFVSRGGHKLDAALERFGVVVSGRRALDAGASTGGFTDCLLQRGASTVVAVDVGRGQLDARLRADPRVTVLEGVNVRYLTPPDVPGGVVGVVVADLSFISLRTVGPVLCGPVAAPGADVVVLVKPQFEAGRRHVSAGRGVITDPEVWRGAVAGVADALASHGAAIMGAMVSPLKGAEGNVEFLLHAVAHRAGEHAASPGAAALDLDALTAEAEVL
ncbi:MAG TPA: TlyA family RNA methyltransferase [Acidimicrobiales bacterium]|nr:TlyA family RNA methyltransferase [Acidimicrobiales bacterium]